MGCGSGMTCWRRLRDWAVADVWAKLHEDLLTELEGAGQIDWSRAVIDSSFVRGPGRRRRDWAQPSGPAKEREQTPDDYRRSRGSPHRNDDSGERPRRGADGGNWSLRSRRCVASRVGRADGRGPSSATEATIRTCIAALLAPARHSTPDRLAENVARQRIGEISLVRGADVVVAAQFRKSARPQGSNPGYPSGVSQTCLRDNLS